MFIKVKYKCSLLIVKQKEGFGHLEQLLIKQLLKGTEIGRKREVIEENKVYSLFKKTCDNKLEITFNHGIL